ncbi:Spore germination protein A1 [compost metagenome]
MTIWSRLYRGLHAIHKISKSSANNSNGKPPIDSNSGQISDHSSLDQRLAWYQEQLKNCSDVIFRQFVVTTGQKCAVIYIKGMINQATIQDFIIKSLLNETAGLTHDNIYEFLFEDNALSVSQNQIVTDLNEGLSSILDAGALLMVDGDRRMMTFALSSYPTRSISEAPNESVIRGPREAFIEDLDTNITFLRRRIKNKDLKIESMVLGQKSQTKLVITYVEGVCKPELISEIKRRLSCIETDSVLGTSYLEEAIEDNPYSPFPQLQYTERPDVVSASMLEGRVGLILDGTPTSLLIPVTLPMLMQASEDYFQRYIAATWIRWIRYFFLFVSLLLPSLYIAITTFHPEMIPTQLLLTLAGSRELVPFPAILEALMMELAFEALREASVRIPKSIGQSVSIIGALIIGTAAVQAGIVSAAMVIIVSLTGIASFIIPHFDLGLTIRLLRFPIMFAASLFGLFGVACGVILIYIHLINLQSFGAPYLSPITPYVKSDMKDVFVRAPWWHMTRRPVYLTRNDTRQKNNSRRWSQQTGEQE